MQRRFSLGAAAFLRWRENANQVRSIERRIINFHHMDSLVFHALNRIVTIDTETATKFSNDNLKKVPPLRGGINSCAKNF